MLLFNTDGIVP